MVRISEIIHLEGKKDNKLTKPQPKKIKKRKSTSKKEDLLKKYIEQRFKNIEEKIDQLLIYNKKVISIFRQVFWAIIFLSIIVGGSFICVLSFIKG